MASVPTGKALVVTAPVPPHLRERLAACGWREETDVRSAEPAPSET